MESKTIKRVSVIFAILPILNGYSLGSLKINIAEIILVCIFPIALLYIFGTKRWTKLKLKGGQNAIFTQPILLLISITTITLVGSLFLTSVRYSFSDVIYRFLRMALWAFSITVTSRAFFCFKYVKKWIIRISIAAVIYIIVQTIAWYALKLNLPSLIKVGPMVPKVRVEDFYQYYVNFYYRPSAFFSEPAYFSYYVVLAIIFTLIPEKRNKLIKNKKVLLLPAFLTLGVFISTSTGGIYVAAFVWAVYIISAIKVNSELKIMVPRSIVITLIIILLVLTISISVLILASITTSLTNVSVIEIILNKPFSTSSSNIRLGGSYTLFNKLEGLQKVLGVGFGNEDSFLDINSPFLNSVTTIALSTGYIGLGASFVFLMNLFRTSKKNLVALTLAFIYVMLCFTEAIAYSIFAIIYLSIIYYIPKPQDLADFNSKIPNINDA